ncbi:DUF1294 domain-containing protein [Sporomusa silvacetica]|uniref:DUF1294 domain-containing protein n=1 Tax=Sporomusa silvacetica TaxID=55504 RepID=UPI000B99D97F|nr:DUF1294 domain-containing protein [Sporomusa silvacetica]
MLIWLVLYGSWNLAAFLMVWLDKHFARKGARRVRERTFFWIALLFGAAGILLGMYVYRHKTLHKSFVIGIPMMLLLNLFSMYILWK